MFSKSDHATPGFYEPSQTALLIMDYHSFIVNIVGDVKGPAVVKVATEMREWAKSKGIHVLHCLIDTEAEPFPTCKDISRLTKILAGLRSNVEEPSQLRDNDGSGNIYLRKPGHVSALKSPGIVSFLDSKGIKSLVLLGISTSGCVLRTAAAATDAEFVVTTISDGCADPDDNVHKVMVESVLKSRGYVATSAEFQKGYETRSV